MRRRDGGRGAAGDCSYLYFEAPRPRAYFAVKKEHRRRRRADTRRRDSMRDVAELCRQERFRQATLFAADSWAQLSRRHGAHCRGATMPHFERERHARPIEPIIAHFLRARAFLAKITARKCHDFFTAEHTEITFKEESMYQKHDDDNDENRQYRAAGAMSLRR